MLASFARDRIHPRQLRVRACPSDFALSSSPRSPPPLVRGLSVVVNNGTNTIPPTAIVIAVDNEANTVPPKDPISAYSSSRTLRQPLTRLRHRRRQQRDQPIIPKNPVTVDASSGPDFRWHGCRCRTASRADLPEVVRTCGVPVFRSLRVMSPPSTRSQVRP